MNFVVYKNNVYASILLEVELKCKEILAWDKWADNRF